MNKIISICRTEFGMIEKLDHKLIDSIELTIDRDDIKSPFSVKGKCTIKYRESYSSVFYQRWDLSHAQTYGIPVSQDGNILLSAGWEKGISAISTRSGKILWKNNQKRIRELLVYPSYVCALKTNVGLLKFDLHTGILLEKACDYCMERCFSLDEKHVLIDNHAGFLVVVNTESMLPVCVYPPTVYNPKACQSWVLQNAIIDQDELVISGFEESFDEHFNLQSHNFFTRSIGTVHLH